jgi:hypothetical protein
MTFDDAKVVRWLCIVFIYAMVVAMLAGCSAAVTTPLGSATVGVLAPAPSVKVEGVEVGRGSEEQAERQSRAIVAGAVEGWLRSWRD